MKILFEEYKNVQLPHKEVIRWKRGEYSLCVMAAEGPFCYLKSKAQGYQVIVGSYIKTTILNSQIEICVVVRVEMCLWCDTVSVGTHIHCDSLPEPPTVFRHSGEVVTFNLYSMTPTQWARASLELTKHTNRCTHTYIGTMSKKKLHKDHIKNNNIYSIGLNDCGLKLCFCFLQVSQLLNYPQLWCLVKP